MNDAKTEDRLWEVRSPGVVTGIEAFSCPLCGGAFKWSPAGMSKTGNSGRRCQRCGSTLSWSGWMIVDAKMLAKLMKDKLEGGWPGMEVRELG